MNKIFTPLLMKKRDTVNTVMMNVLIAALPAICWSVYVFGFRCVSIYAVSVMSAIICQFVGDLIIRKGMFKFDISCVVTGILIGMAMPVSVPLWLPAAASGFAIIAVKMFFGGTGNNLFNPAAAAICFSYIVFGEYMNVFTKPFLSFSPLYLKVPAELLESSRTFTAMDELRAGVVDPSRISEEFYGLVPGSIGTVSALLLFIGLVYLILTRTVHFNSAVAFTLTYMLLCVTLCYADYEPTQFMELQLVSGNLMFIFVFMLNDYITTPTTSMGRLVFAALTAAGIFFVRQYGMVNYGEYFVIVFMNAFSPVIERFTYPNVFGSKVRESI